MAAETHNPEKQRQSAAPLAAVVVLLLLFLPLAYMFSIGPAFGLFDRGYISDPERFYSPLAQAVDRSPAAVRVVQSYLSLWRVYRPPIVDPTPKTVPAASMNGAPALPLQRLLAIKGFPAADVLAYAS